MKRIQAIILTCTLALGLVAIPLVLAPAVSADSAAESVQDGVKEIGGTSNQTDFNTGVKTIVNMLLFLLGLVSVVMIIYGGFRYTTSQGDSGNTKAAKDIILYAVIGLVVAILAFAIVNFVISSFSARS